MSVVVSWQPLQSLLWTLRHDQKHICANLILRVAFIRHADCCSGIFLFLILSFPPSFLLFSLHHRSQGFPLLFTCFFPPFSLLSLSLSLAFSLLFFFSHPVLIQDVPVWVVRMELPRPWRGIGGVGTLVSASPCVGIVSVG